jgi:predicted transcriptional regulator
MRGSKRRKATTLSLRIDPAIKRKAQQLARRGRRSVTALISYLIEQELKAEQRKILRSVARSKNPSKRK